MPGRGDRRRSSVPTTAARPTKDHLDALLDDALEQTFPASDPPALTQPAPGDPAVSFEAKGAEPTREEDDASA
ncbi:MAG TPA: hypothetical protein VFQ27_08750 [Xanthobacteraceae bacterium]|nr:hypothetical protein [Xanthobacteraceae bacterium]